MAADLAAEDRGTLAEHKRLLYGETIRETARLYRGLGLVPAAGRGCVRSAMVGLPSRAALGRGSAVRG